MKKKIIALIVCVAIILALILAYVIINKPNSRTQLSVEPSTNHLEVGQNFSVNLTVLNAVDLYGWQLKLKWNPAILEAVEASESTFLQSRGNTFFAPEINNTMGYVLLDCTLLGNVSGVSGKGTLSAIQFYVKGSGQCDLILSNTAMLDSSEEPIEHVTNMAHFSTP